MIDFHIFCCYLYSGLVNINGCSMSGSQPQGGNGQNAAATAYIQYRIPRLYVCIQCLDTELRCLMGTSSESDARIDLNKDIFLSFFCVFFPGRFDQDMVSGAEWLEKGLPVIDPVFVLCLGQGDSALSNLTEFSCFLQEILYLQDHFLRITVFRFHIEMYLCCVIIFFWIRQDVYKHFLFVFLGKGEMVFDLNSLHSNLIQHITEHIHCINMGVDGKTNPFHGYYLSFFCYTIYCIWNGRESQCCRKAIITGIMIDRSGK